jgi:hypothetical protein
LRSPCANHIFCLNIFIMVSVHSVQQQQPPPQYITDFNSPMPSMDKSPLAMLEKTCETIGLPDTPAKKVSPKTKDSPSSDGKKKDLETIVTKSPRLNPIPSVDKKMMMPGCEPSTSMAAQMFNPNMMQRCFPFPGAAGMQNPMAGAGPMGYNPAMMAQYMMPQFMPPTSMPPMMMTPHMPNGRPCVQPGCQTCAAYSMAAFMPPDVMSQLSMLAAYSNNPAAMNIAAMSSMNSGRHVCTYSGGNGPCGKTFSTEGDHFAHLKSHVAENAAEQKAASRAASRNSTPDKKTLISPKNGTNNRFHPYMKDSRSATPNNQNNNSINNNNNNNQNNINNNMAAAAAAQAAANNNAMAAQMQAILMSMGMMPPMGPTNPLVSSIATSLPSTMSMSFPGMPGPQFNPAAFQAMLAAQQRAGMH